MSAVELIAVVFGILCVGLVARQSIWCWPAGLVQVTLYVWIFYEARLYSDVLLHVIYILLQFYGWRQWLRGGRDCRPLAVSRLSGTAAAAWAGVAAVGTTTLGTIMARWANAALPYWDAAIAVLSLIAQYLMARKVLENWLIWITVDLIALGVYGAKGLYLTTGLYGVFLVLSVMGFAAWRRSLPEPTPA